MKEKTFEELIDENTNWSKATLGGYEKTISTKKCLKLMQLVREATIAEVLTLCDENFFSKEPKGKLMENIENLQTDRIKIKK